MTWIYSQRSLNEHNILRASESWAVFLFYLFSIRLFISPGFLNTISGDHYLNPTTSTLWDKLKILKSKNPVYDNCMLPHSNYLSENMVLGNVVYQRQLGVNVIVNKCIALLKKAKVITSQIW